MIALTHTRAPRSGPVRLRQAGIERTQHRAHQAIAPAMGHQDGVIAGDSVAGTAPRSRARGKAHADSHNACRPPPHHRFPKNNLPNDPRDAPRAFKMPISRVRCSTAIYIESKPPQTR